MTITERAIGSHELVVWATDAASGLQAAIAVHGAEPPWLGEVVLAARSDATEAVLDALRRSETASAAATLLGVPAGGAAVVLQGAPDRPGNRLAFDALGRVMARLGREIHLRPGPGVTPHDLSVVGRHWPHVTGASPADHHLPPEARGAVAAARTVWGHRSAGAGLSGVRVLVLGVERLGAGVARMLAAHDAHVMVCDAEPLLAADLADEVDGELVHMSDALTTECDILMPCRPGLGLTAAHVEALRCDVVAGPSGGQLAGSEVAATLTARGIVWVPDLLTGAGALLAAAREVGVPGMRLDVDADTARIVTLTAEVLEEADSLGEDAATVIKRRSGQPDGPLSEPPPISRVHAA